MQYSILQHTLTGGLIWLDYIEAEDDHAATYELAKYACHKLVCRATEDGLEDERVKILIDDRSGKRAWTEGEDKVTTVDGVFELGKTK